MRFIRNILCLLLLLTAPAQAAVIKTVSGSGWGAQAGTSVTTTNSDAVAGNRFAALGAGTWTYRAATAAELPPGSSATGYMESDINKASMSFQIDATGTAFGGLASPTGDNLHYWLDFWVMPYWDGSTTQAANKADYLFVPIQSGNYVHSQMGLNAISGYNTPSMGIHVGDSAATTPTGLYATNNGSALNPGPIPIAFPATFGGALNSAKWTRLTFHMFYDATNGLMEAYVNGALVQTVTTAKVGAINWSSSPPACTLLFPQLAGMGWRVAGPISTHNGTTITVRPGYNLEKSDAQVTKFFHPSFTAAAGGTTQGRYFQASGTGSVSLNSEYGIGAGQSPYRRKLHLGGTSGQAPVATTIDQIGTLPFNEEGWSHIVWSDVYVPDNEAPSYGTNDGNGAMTLKTTLSDDTTNFYSFSITGGAIFCTYASQAAMRMTYFNQTAGSSGTRYCLILHLHRSGEANYTLIDTTLAQASVGSTALQVITSGPLPDWDPNTYTSLGVASYNGIIDASGNSQEVGFIAVCRRPSLAMVDSMTTAPYTNVTPIVQNAAHIARSFPFGSETSSVPGGYYPLLEYGLERRIIIPIGRSGLTRRDFHTRMTNGMLHTKGCEIINFDGGSINDLVLTTSGDGTVTRLSRLLATAFKLWTSNQNRVWMTTMLPRYRSFTLSGSPGVSKANPAVCTSTAHGLTNSSQVAIYVTGAAGLSVDINGAKYARVTGANTFTLYNSTNTAGIDTSGATGTYTEGSATITGFTPVVTAALTAYNVAIRDAVQRYQTGGLIAFSDIETDSIVNTSIFPNNTAFWSAGDFTHTGDGNPIQEPNGSPVVARRMIQTKVIPPSPSKPRRLAVPSRN